MKICLKGYTLTDIIYDGSISRIYHAIRDLDRRAVIIKLLKAEYPSAEEIAAYETEYALLNSIHSNFTIKAFSLERYQNSPFFVLEDFGGQSLKTWLSGGALPLASFLDISIKAATALNQIHQDRYVYLNMSPSHILYNPSTKILKITDFSLICCLDTTIRPPSRITKLTDMLPYMAPEQTGRMNKSIGRYTDLYSLGATMYELLTGKPPFNVQKTEDFIYSHLAVLPAPLHHYNPSVPGTIESILVKLLAKDPKERYQSAAGLIHDLNLCVKQLSAKGRIDYFPLGRHDSSGHLEIPQKLYGRRKEVDKLNSALIRAGQGQMELMLVTGTPGVGKSALVNHFRVLLQKGRFIQGKFDQLCKNTPYYAWVQAFTEFTSQLLTENGDVLKKWQSTLLKAVGSNGKVLTDLIPNLELVIGKQPIVTSLSPEEDQNRFHNTVKKFITAIAEDCLFVVFLDDLQWADMASLQLLDFLLSGQNNPHFLLMGAYRSNEISNSHPLARLLAVERKNQPLITTLLLKNLTATDIANLLADILDQTVAATAKLADLIYTKTRGNPFFVRQFIRSLQTEKLLRWNPLNLQWEWDIATIRQRQITDNVVELLTGKIRDLPVKTQEILKVAACIGHRFDSAMFQIIFGESWEKISRYLQPAITEGLLISVGQQYCFAHDRIQQTSYSLCTNQEQKDLHLKIGRSLLHHIPVDQQAKWVFDIADQFNFCLQEMKPSAEKKRLAELNLQAGRQAKSSAAYIPAMNYLLAGINALAADSWEHEYSLTLSLFSEAIQASYLGGDFITMKKLAPTVLCKAKTLFDKIPVYRVQAQVCRAENRLPDAVQILLPVLTALGISLPLTPSPEDIQRALEETKKQLEGKKIEELSSLPMMTAPEKLAAMEILATLRPLVYQISPSLLPLTILAGIHLSLEYGNSPLSVSAYSGYAMVLCGVAEDYDDGYRFGRLALDVLPRVNAAGVECKVLFAFNTFVRHYKEAFRKTLPSLQKAAYSGIETGDMEYAAMAAFAYCLFYLFSGNQLKDTLLEMETYYALIANTRQETACDYAEIYRQLVHYLMENNDKPAGVAGEFRDEETLLATYLETKNSMGLCLLYFAKTVSCYFLSAYDQGAKNSELAHKYLAGLLASPFVPLLTFYDSLLALARYAQAEPDSQPELLAKVESNQKKMRIWAQQAPMNYLHKFYLVEAEYNRVLGHDLEAMELYDAAAAEAQQNKFLHMEALSYELAAEFYLSRGRSIIAKAYLTEAIYRYTRWGSNVKVHQLAEKHPTLLLSRNFGFLNIAKKSRNLFDPFQTISEHIDMQAIMKTALVISKELDIAVLCQNILQLVINNAGAEKGCLILEKNGKLVMETKWLTNPAGTVISISASKGEQSLLPMAIINYVTRTMTKVIVSDACQDASFRQSPYIQKNRIRSILCLPLLNRGRSTGLIYLENNAAAGIFTEQRVKVLEILLAQLAISIENARLYTALNRKVKGRTTELESVITELNKLTEKRTGSHPHLAVTFTKREKDILHLVALGQTNKEISQTLSISLETVKSHIHNLLTKTGTTSRTALIARELHSLSIAEEV